MLVSPVRAGPGACHMRGRLIVLLELHTLPLRWMEGMLYKMLGVQNPGQIMPKMDDLVKMKGVSIAHGEPNWDFSHWSQGQIGQTGSSQKHDTSVFVKPAVVTYI